MSPAQPLATAASPVARALYLHVPFCVRRCRYCDFATGAVRHDEPLVAEYARCLGALTGRLARAGLLADVRTAYLGGGTPTMAGGALPGLVRAVRDACPSLREFSSEANPESLPGPLASGLAAAGLTRVSLGVQSLVDAELARLGRVHDARAARLAMGAVTSAGLDLSCDLMCGIPLQNVDSWDYSLKGILEGGACHVSCYPLMVEEGTPLFRACESGSEARPNPDLQADLMIEAEHELEASGMRRYEVASYAAPGHACRHNLAYWGGVAYLGLGTSAASMLSPEGFAALADALPLSCAPEDPETAAPDLWGTPSSSGSDRGGAARARVDGPVCEGRALAASLLAAGPGRVARVRLRMTDGPRETVRLVTGAGALAARVETLSLREALAEDLMLAARTSAGAPAGLLARARAVMGPALDDALDDVCARGLARLTEAGALAPTERGWLLGNELYGALWDLAEPDA